jgi:hypothetical protein
MTGTASRFFPRVIVRQNVLDWLTDHADVGVRLIVAPPGFGKTTALTAYAAGESERLRLYIAIDARTTHDAVTSAIASASAATEIVLDDMHLASDCLRARVNEIVADLPQGITFVIASQRRDIVDVGTLFARGLVALCDQSQLALSLDEVRALFATHEIEATETTIGALLSRTDGWPPAIIGTVREIVREPQSVDAAYARWRRDWMLPAFDLIGGLLERVPLPERTATRRSFCDGETLDQATLAVLHRCGFFVRFNAGTFTLMPWVDELFAANRGQADGQPVLSVGLFGRFTAHVDGDPIVWARRRDQDIIKYLALQPDASATRLELAEIFWPEMARPLALQNLRTACSTIRRAIGSVVGMDNVDAYFIAGKRLMLNRATVVCDVDRFRRHVTFAEADDAAGAVSDAIVHLRAAASLYGNGLFAGDVSQTLFSADARELHCIYARVLKRLSGALIERGSPELAREYATRALKLGLFAQHDAAGSQVHLRFAAS